MYLLDGDNHVPVPLVDEDSAHALLERLQERAVAREVDESLEYGQHRAESQPNVRDIVLRQRHQVVE